MHLAFCKFKQPFMNLCAQFGYTRPPALPLTGMLWGILPSRTHWQGWGSRSPPKMYLGLLW